MLPKNFIVIPITLVTLLTACLDDGKLTNDKAQKAIDAFQGSDSGSIVVIGVQEIPQENLAKASINFNNFQWQSSRSNSLEEYSGHGVATFSHYNDGRWVLTKIETSNGLDSIWWDNLSIEAE
ncbi:MAG TPA: hypothetical protein DCL61_05415 [Cyanobacteria bacterium UBA12227]|nr:hypothetical protein [Cyanobacteria bacterium UBA12227]HAX85814.1 hypothetical protein [Cyanobacteria bacterium UBA11370]